MESAKMTKLGNELIEAMQEALAYAKGEIEPTRVHHVEVPAAPDTRAIRKSLGLSREKFAARFHLSPRTVQEWEQGRRRPDRAVAAYLTVIARDPDAVVNALEG
jgi:putative transcriptional regulator